MPPQLDNESRAEHNNVTWRFVLTVILAFLLLLATVSVATWYAINQTKSKVSQTDTLSPEEPISPVDQYQEVGVAFDQGNFEDALTIIEARLNNDPNDYLSLIAKARILAQQASLERREEELGNQALVYVNQALEIKPDSVDALTLKGYIYEIQEKYQEADELYLAALRINPGFAYALAQYGHSLQLQGRETEAAPTMRRRSL